MANDEKFAKTIDDAELDEVAGGTIKEMQKDIKFLNAMGAELDEKKATRKQVAAAWESLGVDTMLDDRSNDPRYKNVYIDAMQGSFYYQQTHLSRQDAMIVAMRHAKKVVDLDEYN